MKKSPLLLEDPEDLLLIVEKIQLRLQACKAILHLLKMPEFLADPKGGSQSVEQVLSLTNSVEKMMVDVVRGAYIFTNGWIQVDELEPGKGQTVLIDLTEECPDFPVCPAIYEDEGVFTAYHDKKKYEPVRFQFVAGFSVT